MASARSASRPNLRRTFGVAAAILAFGILWLSMGGGQDQTAGAGTAALKENLTLAHVAAGIELPSLDLEIAARNNAPGISPVPSTAGSGDNLAALMWAGLGAVSLTILMLRLAWTHRPANASAAQQELPPPHVISRFSSTQFVLCQASGWRARPRRLERLGPQDTRPVPERIIAHPKPAIAEHLRP